MDLGKRDRTEAINVSIKIDLVLRDEKGPGLKNENDLAQKQNKDS